MIERAGYLGLDLGGTGVKAGVFDESGRLLGFARRSCSAIVTPDGHSEVFIEDIERAARDACAESVRAASIKIRAVSVASQGQTFVSLDESGRPLHPAIMWYDSRASEQADRLRKSLKSVVPTSQMPVIEAITVAPKVMWLREHHPDLMSRASRHLLLPDYISLILTGLAFTDVATASSTGLYVEDAPDYSSEALETAGIPKDALAEIRPPGTRITHIRPEIADEWGLDADTVFVSGTNDQYAGALGAGNCRPRILSETTGTCLALVTLTEKLPDALPPGLFGGRFPIARYQFALAYIKTAGLVLDWFVKEFCPDISLTDLDSMAAGISAGSRGITVLPDFDGMVSPKPNPDARGTISGLTLAHGRADIYRAILESLAYGLRVNVELMRSVGLHIETVRLIGGGAKSDLWCQIKADVLGMPMERPAVPEAAVLGAAMLAAAGAGGFGSIDEAVDSMYQPGRIFQPCRKVEQDYDLAYKTYIEVSAAMYGN